MNFFWRVGLVALQLGVGFAARAEISVTNYPFPGLAVYSETRAQPPTRLFIAEVDLTRPHVRLHVASGGPDPDGAGRWETTLQQPTQIAGREKFDLVVNGDFYEVPPAKDASGKSLGYRIAGWAAVNGPAVSGGKVWSTNATPRPCLVVNQAGKVTIRSLAQPGAGDWEVVAGNEMLVRAGRALPFDSQVRHPRTVVGLTPDAAKLVILVVDGRKPGVAVGMSYAELAAEMVRLGCEQALNLDGGGSSVLAVRDPAKPEFKILNAPTDGRERAVANAMGITFTPDVSSRK